MSTTDSLHYRLCKEAARWIKAIKWGGYKYMAVELVTQSLESPDAWGTNGSESIVIEVKVSRADFLADKKKKIRQENWLKYAAGNYHYYLAPSGVIKVNEIPEWWGLLEWDGKIIHEVKPAANHPTGNYGDIVILCSIMRREGIKPQIFNYRGKRLKELKNKRIK